MCLQSRLGLCGLCVSGGSECLHLLSYTITVDSTEYHGHGFEAADMADKMHQSLQPKNSRRVIWFIIFHLCSYSKALVSLLYALFTRPMMTNKLS